ncbi:Smr/MutS family protein [Ruminococcaceae bacterium OttesenSCG-928-I18]|nr:Smr/MutS family protein [Ruminococcaceae bacterium OttesenSCG-928-I18]
MKTRGYGMDYRHFEDLEKASIDLHGLTVEEAEIRLIEFLNGLPKEVRAVEVTHGYSRGTALKRMVKEDFYHWRVKDKRVGLNPGVTYLLLK